MENTHDALQHVRERLIQWGEWSRSGSGSGTGYPRRASHLADRSGCYFDAFIQSPGIARTDKALMQLRFAHPVMYDVINQEYYWQSSTAAGARRLGISINTYKNRRLMAEYWIDSRLNLTLDEKKVLTG